MRAVAVLLLCVAVLIAGRCAAEASPACSLPQAAELSAAQSKLEEAKRSLTKESKRNAALGVDFQTTMNALAQEDLALWKARESELVEAESEAVAAEEGAVSARAKVLWAREKVASFRAAIARLADPGPYKAELSGRVAKLVSQGVTGEAGSVDPDGAVEELHDEVVAAQRRLARGQAAVRAAGHAKDLAQLELKGAVQQCNARKEAAVLHMAAKVQQDAEKLNKDAADIEELMDSLSDDGEE
ncbi:unnamed protein product [Pedinophyceae sp. YPF-701]|nr:unnamed protein product [Pedinophyceae sp. YPF-701]